MRRSVNEGQRRSVIRGSNDEPIKNAHDRLYITTDVSECAVKGLAADFSRFVERYCKQKVLLHHHHMAQARVTKVYLSEYCATFNHASGPDVEGMETCSG